ncbi:MAG: YegP family protein [Bacteroidetes bacterium]|nr:YegP family protein [Bacteroidota bacterium]
MENPKYQIKNSSDDQFYFVLKAGNGEVILTSEMYTAKQNCENGIESVKKNGEDDSNYDRLTSSNDKDYFNLKSADNGQVIGKSEMYESSQGMENGIQSVKDNRNSGTEDLT